MKGVLQKEQQEAERKRIEAQGIADFQRIKLAGSQNTKVVVIGNTKTGLPIILGEK